MKCENDCGKTARGVKGNIGKTEFNFCSQKCRKEFADFSGRLGHHMTLQVHQEEQPAVKVAA